jgi:hypothetical protein
MKRMVLWAAVLLAAGAALAPLGLQAGELPIERDFGKLGLKVVETHVIPSIAYRGAGPFKTTIVRNPPPRHQYVVVSLRGKTKKPCRLFFDIREFTAYRERSGIGPDGKPETYAEMWNAHGVDSGGGFVGYIHEDDGVIFGVYFADFPKAGPVTLAVAFLLPKEVDSFSVRYPAVAGKVAVPRETFTR